MAAIIRSIAFAGLLTPAIAMLLGGCGTMSQRLSGTYVGTLDIPTNPGVDPVVAAQLKTLKLIVVPNSVKAVLSDQGIPVGGHLEYGSKVATFVPEKFLGTLGASDPDKLSKYSGDLQPNPDGTWTFAGKTVLRPDTSDSPFK